MYDGEAGVGLCVEPLGGAVGAAVVDDQYAVYRTVGTEARDVTLQQGEAIVCDYYCYYHCMRFKFEFGVWLLTLTRPEAAEKYPTRDASPPLELAFGGSAW